MLAQFAHPQTGEVGPAEMRTLLWADWMIPGAEPARYNEVASMTKMAEVGDEAFT